MAARFILDMLMAGARALEAQEWARMTKEEAKQLLTAWREHCLRLDSLAHHLLNIGFAVESSPVLGAQNALEDLTDDLADLFDCREPSLDIESPLHWYAYECQFGQRPMRAVVGGEERVVETVDDLLWSMGLKV